MRVLYVALLLLLAMPLKAESLQQVLSLKEPPAGVVFEILAPSQSSWQQIQPQLLSAIEQLRERFPGVDVAVVSHGNEQFALLTKNRGKFASLHQGVLDLGTQGVDVHVCGTYASWRDIKPDEFPEYVDVSASGPAQINDYKAIGYLLVEDFAF